MALSTEANITVNPPYHLRDGATPSHFTPSNLPWITGTWHTTHSTNPEEQSSKRNARICLSLIRGSNSVSSDSEGSDSDMEPDKDRILAVRSYQDLTSPAIQDVGQTDLFLDELDQGFTQVNGPIMRQRWEILAWGKEGQLEEWMTEDGSGWIVDNSGEARPDWRNSYVVVYIGNDLGNLKNVGEGTIEIWDRFGPSGPLREETIEKIREALKGLGGKDERFAKLAQRLERMRMDEGRRSEDDARIRGY
ncbi:hypothetical protein QBC45DRAFT_405694 [Copromyces sp. CBS 386.78]|uniref:Uncharacterized protein n=1 Tax=Pseudoneurospora amorphoporcata TaxID=241081 RepID=A0AAN6NYG3_9PEZI|nr:hypothetical protein QBC45DRAFT_405694 [Copromyces sp. CBS 386.78]KAK3953294.1 hypothetical protein QBC32DRAFT_339356 [Pseudoneurospora amorphoporcata]